MNVEAFPCFWTARNTLSPSNPDRAAFTECLELIFFPRVGKRERERKECKSSMVLSSLIFPRARDLINRITRGLMKSELSLSLPFLLVPSLFISPLVSQLNSAFYVKTEIFARNTFTLPPPAFPPPCSIEASLQHGESSWR